jgi:hypothetical protein
MSSAPYDQSVGAPDPGPGPDRDASLADLISRLSDDVTALFRQEVELAKLETKQEAARAARAGALLGAGAVLGLVTVLLVAWTAAWGLSEVLPIWLAFLVTAAVFGALTGALVAVGRKRMAEVDLTPRRTLDSVRQDTQVLSDRMTS